ARLNLVSRSPIRRGMRTHTDLSTGRYARSVKAGVGLSTAADTRAAAIAAAMEARSTMDGPADLAVVFASPHHATAAEAVVEAVYEAAGPHSLIGCVAEAVVGGDREVEGEPGVSVWLGRIA